MRRNVVFSDHAEVRVKERFTLTMNDFHERIKARAYVVIGSQFQQDTKIYFWLFWDRGLGAGAVLLLEDRKSHWSVITAYPTMLYAECGGSVPVLPRHMASAHRKDRAFWGERDSGLSGAVVIEIFIRFIDKGRAAFRHLLLPHVPFGEYQAYGSPRKYLLAEADTEKFKNIDVPLPGCVEIVLYHHQAPGRRVELDEFVLEEGLAGA